MRLCSSFYYSASTNKLGISLVRVGVRGIMLPLLKYVFVHMMLGATMSLNVKKKENIVSRGWGGWRRVYLRTSTSLSTSYHNTPLARKSCAPRLDSLLHPSLDSGIPHSNPHSSSFLFSPPHQFLIVVMAMTLVVTSSHVMQLAASSLLEAVVMDFVAMLLEFSEYMT